MRRVERERERANSVSGAVVSAGTTLQRFNESIVGALIAAAVLSIVQIHSMLIRTGRARVYVRTEIGNMSRLKYGL